MILRDVTFDVTFDVVSALKDACSFDVDDRSSLREGEKLDPRNGPRIEKGNNRSVVIFFWGCIFFVKFAFNCCF